MIQEMVETEDDKIKIEDLRMKLYELQINNADLVRKAIQGYKPVQGTKAWSNDPDYEALLQRFEEAVLNGPGKGKKGKKKKNLKRIKGKTSRTKSKAKNPVD